MKILFFCPYWGSEKLSMAEFCARAAGAGYDGIELSLTMGDRAGTDAILEGVRKNSLLLIAQHWETSNPDVEAHKAEYLRRLEWLADAKPLFINSQTGRDFFPFEKNREILKTAMAFASSRGLRVLHETHRGKFSFAAATTAAFLRELPELHLSADFSHWCVVSESLLADQGESLDLAISRADHIHARVGFAEAPQVSDPRAPEHAEALAAHLGWWDRIVKRHRESKAETMTVTPEFGPWPYLPALPYTRMPVVDQWELNVHMMEMLRKRWS